MELLLNLCWLLLIGPGIYLWLVQRRRAKPVLQFSIALVCLLFLLFPIISATDDLHAMRAEMEESSLSKRALKHVAKRASAQDLSAPPAELPVAARVLPLNLVRSYVVVDRAATVISREPSLPVSRPPPSRSLVSQQAPPGGA